MNAIVEKPKLVRPHTNISKVVVELDGQRYRFNLTRGGLVVRRFHARKTKVLAFSQLLDLSIEQFKLL